MNTSVSGPENILIKRPGKLLYSYYLNNGISYENGTDIAIMANNLDNVELCDLEQFAIIKAAFESEMNREEVKGFNKKYTEEIVKYFNINLK